jgi:hypothetical protein
LSKLTEGVSTRTQVCTVNVSEWLDIGLNLVDLSSKLASLLDGGPTNV